MAPVRGSSIIYGIIGGEHKRRTCVIMNFTKDRDGNEVPLVSDDGFTNIIFIDTRGNDMMRVLFRYISALDTPGWSDTTSRTPYDFQEHLRRQGTGDNCLRTEKAAQPRALNKGDVLANGDRILAVPRRGYNSSCLIKTEKFGWVEIAPRIPIALFGSKDKEFKLAPDFVNGDTLATGCKVLANPVKRTNDWTDIVLTGGVNGHEIDVPNCIPIALLKS